MKFCVNLLKLEIEKNGHFSFSTHELRLKKTNGLLTTGTDCCSIYVLRRLAYRMLIFYQTNSSQRKFMLRVAGRYPRSRNFDTIHLYTGRRGLCATFSRRLSAPIGNGRAPGIVVAVAVTAARTPLSAGYSRSGVAATGSNGADSRVFRRV